MTKRFQPGCPCCGCQYHFDNFNRSSSSDVGDDYTEVSGDWSIVDFGGGEGSLLIQASNAVLSIDVDHPNELANGIVGFVFYAFHDGDQPRFIFNYSDSDNYYFVQVTTGASGSLSIYQRVGGADQLLATCEVNAPSGQFLTLYVYFGERCGEEEGSYVYAYMPENDFNPDLALIAVETDDFTEDSKALGTGNLTSAIYFDQLTLWKHRSESDTSCPCSPTGNLCPWGIHNQPSLVVTGITTACTIESPNGELPFAGFEFTSSYFLCSDDCFSWRKTFNCGNATGQLEIVVSCSPTGLTLYVLGEHDHPVYAFASRVFSTYEQVEADSLTLDDLGRLTGTMEVEITQVAADQPNFSETITIQFNGG